MPNGWATSQLSKAEAVVRFAEAFTFIGSSSTIGDRVAVRRPTANVSDLNGIVDRNRLRVRCEEVLAQGTLEEKDELSVREFLAAWDRHEHDV